MLQTLNSMCPPPPRCIQADDCLEFSTFVIFGTGQNQMFEVNLESISCNIFFQLHAESGGARKNPPKYGFDWQFSLCFQGPKQETNCSR
jgi:hypothetical protein